MSKSSRKPSIPHLQVDRGRASPESEDSFSLAAEPSPGSQRSFSMDAESNDDVGVPPTPEVGEDVELESSASEHAYGIDQSPPRQTQDDCSMDGSPSPQSSQYSYGIESTPLPDDLEDLMLARVLASAAPGVQGVAPRVDAPTLPDASSVPVIGSPVDEHTKTKESCYGLSAAPREFYCQ